MHSTTFWEKKSNSAHFAQSPLSTVFVPKVLFVEENVPKLYTAEYDTGYISEKSSPMEIFLKELFKVYAPLTKKFLKAGGTIL